MKICSRCLLPETHETITFNSDGICSVCSNRDYRNSQISWSDKRIELDRIATKYRGNGDYDCLVPFSGGKDSTFTLLYVVKELQMKPLVVSFDHGFFRPKTLENRERVVEKLGVDLVTFKPNWKVVRLLMLQSLIDKGDFCWHCHTGIFAYPMWVALEKNIPLIFWGEPSSEYTSYYSYEDEEVVDEDRFNQINTLGITANDMLLRIGSTVSERDLKPFTYPPKKDLAQSGVVSLPLGSFIPWNTKEQSKIISKELDWQGDEVEGIPSEYSYEKIECYMQGVRDYIKFRKRGYSRVTHLASIDIRSGRIDRLTGESMVKDYEGARPASLDIFLSYLGISEDEFERIISKHVVDPWENKTFVKIGRKPPDFDSWRRKDGLRTSTGKTSTGS